MGRTGKYRTCFLEQLDRNRGGFSEAKDANFSSLWF